MADYGVSVKKALYNGATVNKHVTDCADYELAYSSKFLVPKQASAGRNFITINSTTVPAVATITHNLGYVPIFFVSMELTSGSSAYSPLGNDGLNGFFDCYATTTQLVITQHIFSLFAFGIYYYYYYIFYDDSGAAYG